MSGAILWAAALLVTGVLAWILGSRWGGGRYRAVLLQLARELRAGEDLSRLPAAEGPPEARQLQEALTEAWARRARDPDRAVREALERVAAYLREEVAAPLERGARGGGDELRTAAERAVGAVEDLEFFLRELPEEVERANLAALTQRVGREYAAQWDVLLKHRVADAQIPVEANPEALMDALYLVLHNAGRFGEGQPVVVEVRREGGEGVVRVRDQGPGFTAEALERAYDPFYSTTTSGLGLGLSHARRVVHRLGGELVLRNAPGGGAEVEVRLPMA